MKPFPANPCLGDWHFHRDYPPGTLWRDIFDFSVWDGQRWVPANQIAAQIYKVQVE